MNDLRIPLFKENRVREDFGVSIFHFFSIHLYILLLTKPFDFTVKWKKISVDKRDRSQKFNIN